jgi:hypothetical protein
MFSYHSSLALLQVIQYAILQRVKLIVLKSLSLDIEQNPDRYQPSQAVLDLSQKSEKSLLFLIACNLIGAVAAAVTIYFQCITRRRRLIASFAMLFARLTNYRSRFLQHQLAHDTRHC